MTAQQPFEAYDQTKRKIFRFSRLQLSIASLQTSILQVSNRTVGDSMSTALGSDVRRHLSGRARKMVLPSKHVNQPDATSYSKDDSDSQIESDVFSRMGLEPILHPSCAQNRATSPFPCDSFSTPSIKKPSSMKQDAMFLRTDCILPEGMGLVQRRFGEKWMSVENVTSATLDARVRSAGWHFMWLQTAHSRLGIGRTAESATSKAVALALKQTEGRFNAAELGVVKVRRYPGFHVARATLHTRQIQQHASLGLVDEMVFRQLPSQ
jgi:hypothetical protein